MSLKLTMAPLALVATLGCKNRTQWVPPLLGSTPSRCHREVSEARCGLQLMMDSLSMQTRTSVTGIEELRGLAEQLLLGSNPETQHMVVMGFLFGPSYLHNELFKIQHAQPNQQQQQHKPRNQPSQLLQLQLALTSPRQPRLRQLRLERQSTVSGYWCPLRWRQPMLRAMAQTPPIPPRGTSSGMSRKSAVSSQINQGAGACFFQCETRLGKSSAGFRTCLLKTNPSCLTNASALVRTLLLLSTEEPNCDLRIRNYAK